MDDFDKEFDAAPEASFDEEFDKAPAFDEEFDKAPAAVETKKEKTPDDLVTEDAKDFLGAGGTGLALEASRRAVGSDKAKSIAENLAYRGIGGRTTPEGKKFYVESLGKNLDPDMVNVTPNTVGRQVLDENILGTLGINSPESQLISQRKVTQSKLGDKANFLAPIDSPTAIDKQALLAEYQALINPTKLDPAVDLNRNIISGISKDAKHFTGAQSILENEQSKTDLQSRSKYDGNSAETARQQLDKAQAEARRVASENAVKAKMGQAGLDEFQALKQRSGNASVAEKIIAKNTLTDGINPGTIDKFSKIATEYGMEKLPAVGAKIVDGANKLANSKVAKALPFIGTGLGLLTGDADAAVDGAMGDVPVAGQIYDAVKPESAGDAMDDRMMRNEVRALDNYKNSPARQDKNKMMEVVSQNPEQLNGLAQKLEQTGGAASSYAGPLRKAAEGDERTRAAVLFGLYQQPAFREAIGSDGTFKTDIPGVKKSNN